MAGDAVVYVQLVGAAFLLNVRGRLIKPVPLALVGLMTYVPEAAADMFDQKDATLVVVVGVPAIAHVVVLNVKPAGRVVGEIAQVTIDEPFSHATVFDVMPEFFE